MSKNTKIVEFFGLPGCGKTTLCNKIVNNKNNFKNATIKELSDEIKNSSLRCKILSFPCYIILSLIRLFFSFPFVGFKGLNFYLFFLKKEAEYSFVDQFSHYDNILIEHGHAQSILSLFYGHSERLNEKMLKSAENLISKSKLSEIVYCKVRPQTALHRIRKRGRIIGRLDAIKDDDVLLSELIMLNEKFDLLANMLQPLLKGRFKIVEND